MPTFTPWRPFPDVPETDFVGDGSGGLMAYPVRSDGDDFAALADATINPADGTSTSAGFPGLHFAGAYMGYAGRLSSPMYSLDQLDLDIRVEASDLWTPPLPWPAGTILFERYPNTRAEIRDNLSELTLTFDLIDVTATALPTNVACDVGVIAVVTPVADLTYDSVGRSSVQWRPAAALTDTVLDVAFPMGTTTMTVTTSNLVPAHPLIRLADFWSSLHLTLAFNEQRTHLAPPGVNGRAVTLDNLIINTVVANNRYRFEVDAIPPLRQRQRPTGLGAAYGSRLRQVGTLGDDQPPLRQRRAL